MRNGSPRCVGQWRKIDFTKILHQVLRRPHLSSPPYHTRAHSKINTTGLVGPKVLNAETTTLLLLFLRFSTPNSRNVTTFAPCSGHTQGLTAAHDTHVFTVQHSRRVSGVQNSSTACYGITPKKSSHFCSPVRALSLSLFALQHKLTHTVTHNYHTCPRHTRAPHLLRKCNAKHSHTSASSSLFALSLFFFLSFLSPKFCHCLSRSPSLSLAFSVVVSD